MERRSAALKAMADYDVSQRRACRLVGVDTPVAMIDTSGQSTIITYYHQDRLGNVVALTDGTGAVTQRYSYDEFGADSAPITGNPIRWVPD